MGILQSNATVQNKVASLLGMAASFIPYTKNVTNVSATGVAAAVCPTKNGFPIRSPYVVTKFADDRGPIQIEDWTAREAATTTQGKLMIWGVVPKVKVVLSVIPCTIDDEALGKMLAAGTEFNLDIYQIRQSAPAAPLSAFGIGKAKAKQYGIQFFGGAFLSGPPSDFAGQPQGQAEANGRWSGHSYSFLFTQWRMIEENAAAPGFWSSLGKTVGIG